MEVLLEAAEARWPPAEVPRRVIVAAVRAAVAAARQSLQTAAAPPADAEALRELILTDVGRRIKAILGPHYRKAINATGIILHTGLGRAVLPAQALRQIVEELSGFSVLQIDVAGGQRSRRDERIEELLRLLTGAEAATVVNNNAAATAIALSTVAAGKEVIVSRGQLVEIGGSFRLPEVMAAAGAKLVEVGTTNKTHLRDYERAISERSAAILRVHPSNYKIVGFTAEVPLEELVRLGRAHGLAVIDDVGAGPLIDFSQFGFEKEPTLAESVAAGADVITCQRRQADRRPPGRDPAGQGALDPGHSQESAGQDRPPGQADAGRAGGHARAVSRSAAGALRSADAAHAPPRSGGHRDAGRTHCRGDPGLRARREGRGRRGLLADGKRLAAGPGPADAPGGRRRPRIWKRARLPAACGGTTRRSLRGSGKGACWPIRARSWTGRKPLSWRHFAVP